MMVSYSKVINGVIIEAKTEQKLGQVSDLLYTKKNFSVSGVVIKNSTLLKKELKFISSNDILEIVAGAVLVVNADALMSEEESLRLKEAYNKKQVGIGQKVFNKSGKYLGKVFDYVIAGNTFMIAKIYVKGIFKEKIITRDAIVEVKDNKIIVKDDLNLGRVSAIPAETAA